jgi:hypothetical protein
MTSVLRLQVLLRVLSSTAGDDCVVYGSVQSNDTVQHLDGCHSLSQLVTASYDCFPDLPSPNHR